MTRRAGWGVVTLAAADLRAEPRHAAELRSQLLLGEVVRVESRRPREGWIRVTGAADGYRGWTRIWSIVPVTTAAARRWQRSARARVVAPVTHLHADARPGEVLMPAFLGSRLVPLGRKGRDARVRLPDGREARLPASAVAVGAPVSLARRIASLMGVPYLWGGRTPAGFDCSGFTQVVLAEQGIAIPRDAKDQFRAARPLARGQRPRAGDLVFFARPREAVSHVGIMTGPDTYVHCRGLVRVASLDPDNLMFDKDLRPQLRGMGRPAKGPPRPASEGGKGGY